MPVLIKWYFHVPPSVSQTVNPMKSHRVSGLELWVNANSRDENCWLSHSCFNLGRLPPISWYGTHVAPGILHSCFKRSFLTTSILQTGSKNGVYSQYYHFICLIYPFPKHHLAKESITKCPLIWTKEIRRPSLLYTKARVFSSHLLICSAI